MAPLRKEAQESFLALVLDKKGRPLEIIRHTVGLTDSAEVEPRTITGAIHAVPGAARVWVAHNHPSGNAAQSHADTQMHYALEGLFSGTGIDNLGSIVVAPAGKSSVYETWGPRPGRAQNGYGPNPERLRHV